ncbi:unnamed protein product [Brachionus calyciflorus]|uniref:EF-hand domain-containing protein n=1 Tax=Brachionus calyciflorus TaxID=104777 RepID=A0A814CEU8_9BILA|nr:unnamed protein product [Brachionus calyciflorus]
MSQKILQTQTFSSMLERNKTSSTFSLSNLSPSLPKTSSQQSLSSLTSSINSYESNVSNAISVSKLNNFIRNSRQKYRNTNLTDKSTFSQIDSRRSVSLISNNTNQSFRISRDNQTKIDHRINKSNSSLKNNLTQKITNGNESLNNLKEPFKNSSNKIQIDATQKITVNNKIKLNQIENINWKGRISLNQYPLNHDPNPDIIRKKPIEKVKFNQNINVRYLNPPKLPKPGDIIIRHEPSKRVSPPPPLIIRHIPSRPQSPSPLIFREEPPKTPEPIPSKIITLPAVYTPPPPRKVVIEKLPQIPQKPPAVLVERWLPYTDLKRRVIYEKPSQPKKIFPEPKNLIVDWEKPDVEIVQDLRNLGIVEANPKVYKQKYSDELRPHNELPDFIKNLNPEGMTLASEKPIPKIELEGDLDALKLIDLDEAGLSEYKEYIYEGETPDAKPDTKNETLKNFLLDLFMTSDTDHDGYITVIDAIRIILHLNNRFGLTYTESNVIDFFTKNTTTFSSFLDYEEFARAFYKFYS